MVDYSVKKESKRVFDALVNDKKLGLVSGYAEAAQKVSFVNGDDAPFVPMPCKVTESSSALFALLASAANIACAERYGVPLQNVTVNTDMATVFLESIFLPTINGEPATQNPKLIDEFKKADIYQMSKPVHAEATNVYKTSDGHWYHLHASMNAGPTMKMLDVAEQDMSTTEAVRLWGEKVGHCSASYLEKLANDTFRQAGTTCLTPQQFFATEQGRIMGDEPLWSSHAVKAPRSTWPKAAAAAAQMKPLAGIRVIDYSRVIAAPVVSKLLALMGAEVIKVSNDKLPDVPTLWVDLSTGKKDANIDLKSEQGKEAFAKLVEGADVLINGYRPGVLDRLGFGVDKLRKLNPKLVYTRENCYGFKGPLAERSGWQQISDCLTGISWLQGRFLHLNEPVVPPLPNSDYQTGLVGAIAITNALIARTRADTTFDLEISLTQYNIFLYRLGQYDDDVASVIRARNPDFNTRHYDGMPRAIPAVDAAMRKARPDIFANKDNFCKMSGKDWGLDADITILGAPFGLEKSTLAYEVPSGCRGRSEPKWTAAAA